MKVILLLGYFNYYLMYLLLCLIIYLLLLDCYSDLVLAWIVLEKGGILAVDDYTYKFDCNLLDSPFEAVNHFLKRYEGKYTILYKGYRVFLQKL